MSFFSTLLGRIRASRSGASVVGLDIGATSVKAVQLRKDKGRVILETYGALATGPYDRKPVGAAVTLSEDAVATLITDLFKEANITTNDVALAIPLKSSLVVTIELPPMTDQELARAVPIEARKYVPVPINEVALDWWVIPSREPESALDLASGAPAPTPTAEVLVAAIHKGTLAQYQKIAELATLSISISEIETFSLIRSSLEGNTLVPVAIIDIGAASSKMAIVDYGVVKLSHTIGKGAQDVTTAIARSFNVDFARAEEIKREAGLVESIAGDSILPSVSPVLEYIFSEANRVIIEYQKAHNRSVGKIIFIGGGALLKGMMTLAEKSFSIPLALGTPFAKVATPAFLESVLKEAGLEFAVSIGVALRALEDR